MTRRLRLQLLAMMLAVVAMVAERVAGDVHRVVVMHVTCETHGQTVELPAAPGAGHVHERVAAWVAGMEHDGHDHGCLGPAAAPVSLQSTASGALADRAEPTVSVGGGGHFAPPPLRFAPKTSPPRAG